MQATQAHGGKSMLDAKLWQGEVLNGNYPLLQYLGGSERSAVFLTQAGAGTNRKAAIKIIPARGESGEVQLARWQLAARLSHPHLVQVFQIGRCQMSGEEFLFVVTEYADETLSQILPQRPLTDVEAREMLKPTLEALAYLHENGFAHGRLKPSNILVVGETLKVSSDSVCSTGVRAAGRPNSDLHVAPEVEREGFTPAGDVWSLGVTLCEALTQSLPVWTDRLRAEPSIPSEMPQPFGDIVMSSLRRDPRSRLLLRDISTRLQPPAEVLKKREAAVHRKLAERTQTSPGIYSVFSIGILAVVALLASLLHRSSTTEPTSSQPAAASQQERAKSGSSVAGAASAPRSASQQAVQQVIPQVPEKALRTVHGRLRVNVRVYVDASGNVARAEFANAGPSKYFSRLAIEAAREWKFTPVAGKTWMLQFVFRNSGVSVHPLQL